MSLPLVLNCTDLQDAMASNAGNDPDTEKSAIRIIDLRPAEAFAAGHIPGAVHGDVTLLNRAEKPVGGLMPEPEALHSFLRSTGARQGEHLIGYDGGRETSAARLVWVLDAYGYEACSWLNGGFAAWRDEGLPVSEQPEMPNPGSLSVTYIGDNVISADALMTKLGEDSLSILDVRTTGEYEGSDVRSAFGGHVPGARHLEWTTLLDEHGRLLSDAVLETQLKDRNVSIDDTVVVYCQTHQRSAVTYVALKHLGFKDVRAIDGAWSNWGNREDTPKEL